RLDLGVRPAEAGVETLADDAAVADQHGADDGVRLDAAAPALGERDRPGHVRSVSGEVGRRNNTAPDVTPHSRGVNGGVHVSTSGIRPEDRTRENKLLPTRYRTTVRKRKQANSPRGQRRYKTANPKRLRRSTSQISGR